MQILPQLRLINILWAIAWLGLFFAAWRIEPQRETLIELVIFSVQWLSIPIAIGALFGHQLRGFIAGVAIYFFALAATWIAILSGMGAGP